jgi:hypothetical protein
MYQLKCKAIALAVEAQAFKAQEQREKRLLQKWKKRAELGRLKALQRGDLILGPSPEGAYSATLQGIHLHRVNMIRKEARCALLAYGFLKGRSYREMENFSWYQPNWERVKKLALRYAEESDEALLTPEYKETFQQVVAQQFAEWQDAALEGVQPRWAESVQPGSMRNSGGNQNFNSVTYNADWIAMQRKRNAVGQDAADAVEQALSLA